MGRKRHFATWLLMVGVAAGFVALGGTPALERRTQRRLEVLEMKCRADLIAPLTNELQKLKFTEQIKFTRQYLAKFPQYAHLSADETDKLVGETVQKYGKECNPATQHCVTVTVLSDPLEGFTPIASGQRIARVLTCDPDELTGVENLTRLQSDLVAAHSLSARLGDLHDAGLWIALCLSIPRFWYFFLDRVA